MNDDYALHRFIDDGNLIGAVRHLQSNPGHKPSMDQYRRDELMHAADELQPEMVDLLLRHEFDPNAKSINNQMPLEYVIASVFTDTEKKIQIVKSLITKGADPNIEGRFPSVMALAIQRGETEIVKILAPLMTDINREFQYGATYMSLVASYGDLEMMQALKDAGATIEKSKNASTTELHEAINSMNDDVALQLIEDGADINAVTKNGMNETPLLLAISTGSIKVINELLKRKCNIYHKNAFGDDAHTWAIKTGKKHIIEIIEKAHLANLEVIEGGVEEKENDYEPPDLKIIITENNTQNTR